MKILKKIILLSILIITTNVLNAQSLAQLDIKNGFRNLKLGTPPSSISNKISVKTNFDNVKIYKYTGKDINSVYGIKVSEIKLHYYNNKLMTITINFGDAFDGPEFTISQYNSIITSLEGVYSNDNSNLIQNSNVLRGTKWVGQKVDLEVVMFNSSHYGFNTGYLNIYDKKLMRDYNNNQF
ncbi:hypothetical protein ACTS9U_13410 [Empedobacter falsenii]